MEKEELARLGVMVRDLEWEGYHARALGQVYTIRCSASGDWVWQSHHMGKWFPAASFGDAKAAAQADCDARICAALMVKP